MFTHFKCMCLEWPLNRIFSCYLHWAHFIAPACLINPLLSSQISGVFEGLKDIYKVLKHCRTTEWQVHLGCVYLCYK